MPLAVVLFAAGLCAQPELGVQGPSRLYECLAALGDPARAESAHEELLRLLAQPDTLLDADAERARAAIDRARRQVPAADIVHRSWFEYAAADFLLTVGLYREGLSGLCSFRDAHPKVEAYDLERRSIRAQLLLLLGEYVEARHQLDLLVDSVGDRSGYERHFADAEGLRAQVWEELGVIDRARVHLRRQESLAEESADSFSILQAVLRRADFNLLQRRAGEVDPIVRAARERFPGGLGPFGPQLAVYEGVACSALEREDPERPKRAARILRDAVGRALPHPVRVLAELTLFDLALRAGDLEEAELRRGVCERLLAGSGGQGALDDPTYVAYLSRLALARSTPSAELGDQLVLHRRGWNALLERWRRTPQRRGGVGFLRIDARRAILSELIQLERRVLGEQAAARAAFDAIVSAQALGSLSRELIPARADAPPLAVVRAELLRAGQGLLIYMPSRTQSHLLLVDRERLIHAELASSLPLLARIRDWNRHLRRSLTRIGPEQRDDHAAILADRGRAVRELLIPDDCLEVVRSWSEILVVGSNLLEDVPFECLTLPDGRLLGHTHAVTTVPSVPLGVHMVRTRHRPVARAQASVRLLATLWADASLLGAKSGEVRPLDDDDLASLLSPFSAARRATLLGPALTPSALRAFHLDGTVNHLLAHGWFDPERERGAALALCPEGRDDPARGLLTCDDIDRLDVEGLVIVSACGAARGRSRVGDEGQTTTLGGSFLRAGAHTVVLSRAEIVLEAHLELMAVAHRELLGGVSTAEALRRARVARAAVEDALSAFTHAQIRAVGLGHLPVVR